MPIHRDDAATRRALAAIEGADQFIVVVDGGERQTIAIAEASGATVISLSEQKGPASARNAGAQIATGDILFFIDSDVLITAEVLPHVRQVFTNNPALTALIGSYDDSPDDPAFLSQYRNLLHHYTHQQSGGETSTFWGACGAVRRDAFFAVGGFDEGYTQSSIEDIELGYRLRAAGYHLRLDPTLQVKHLKCWTLPNMLYTDLLRRALPWSRLILLRGGFEEKLNIERKQRVSVVLSFVLLPTAMISRRGGVVVMSGLCWLNRPFYHFIWRKHGTRFLLKTLFCHWIYFLCSGSGFFIACAEYLLRRVWRG